MVLDTSAVIAVLFREKQWEQLEESMEEAGSLVIGLLPCSRLRWLRSRLTAAKGQVLLSSSWSIKGFEFSLSMGITGESPSKLFRDMERGGIRRRLITATA